MPTEKLTKLKIKLLEADDPQYQIAAACGIHPSILSSYALGQRPMPVRHMRALAKYFKCTQQDLQGWETIKWEELAPYAHES